MILNSQSNLQLPQTIADNNYQVDPQYASPFNADLFQELSGDKLNATATYSSNNDFTINDKNLASDEHPTIIHFSPIESMNENDIPYYNSPSGLKNRSEMKSAAHQSRGENSSLRSSNNRVKNPSSETENTDPQFQDKTIKKANKKQNLHRIHQPETKHEFIAAEMKENHSPKIKNSQIQGPKVSNSSLKLSDKLIESVEADSRDLNHKIQSDRNNGHLKDGKLVQYFTSKKKLSKILSTQSEFAHIKTPEPGKQKENNSKSHFKIKDVQFKQSRNTAKALNYESNSNLVTSGKSDSEVSAKLPGVYAQKLEFVINQKIKNNQNSLNNSIFSKKEQMSADDNQNFLWSKTSKLSQLQAKSARQSFNHLSSQSHKASILEIIRNTQSGIKQFSYENLSKISINFDSKTLGNVNLHIQENGGNLQIQLHVPNDMVRDRVQLYRQEITNQMNNLGYSDVAFDVSSENDPPPDQNNNEFQGNENEENVKLPDETFFTLQV